MLEAGVCVLGWGEVSLVDILIVDRMSSTKQFPQFLLPARRTIACHTFLQPDFNQRKWKRLNGTSITLRTIALNISPVINNVSHGNLAWESQRVTVCLTATTCYNLLGGTKVL